MMGWRRVAWSMAAVCAAAATVSAPWWGPRALATLDFFHVRRVDFDGLRFADATDLLQRLRVDTTQSIWQPLDTLVARLSLHPLVSSVDVRRSLPGALRVIVVERVPVALVPGRGGLRPADVSGAVLPIDPSVTALDMPLAATPDTALLSVLDGLRRGAPALYARVTQARRARDAELQFTLSAGAHGAAGPPMTNAILVRTSTDVTVARFSDILTVESDLARNHLRVIELDLRFRDQVIARQP